MSAETVRARGLPLVEVWIPLVEVRQLESPLKSTGCVFVERPPRRLALRIVHSRSEVIGNRPPSTSTLGANLLINLVRRLRYDARRELVRVASLRR